ncbi:MAG: ribosome maturation factor RimM [Burkholderia sp.]|nr:ribosome maturation factor RimM [Burkholderia sp.]
MARQVNQEIVSGIKSVRTLPNDAVEIGVIINAYGLSGWIKVATYSNIRFSSNTILSARNWWLQKGTDCRAVVIMHVKMHGTIFIANLARLDSRDAAMSIRGFRIFVRRADFPVLAKDEFYWVDLIGLDVINKQSLVLGKVTEIIDNGVHSILQVEDLSTTKTRAPTLKKRLIPFICLYIKKVDQSMRRIVVDWKTDY